jgi:hypothetical protein
MLRRVLATLAAVAAVTVLSGVPAAQAGGPSTTVGPITLNGLPSCC